MFTQNYYKIYIILTINFCEISNQTSKYCGVSWHKDAKRWQTLLVHNKERYYGGHFDNEEHAAMQVNLLCDKYETERKNPMINVDLEAIQKVIHSLFIVHRKVK